MVITMSTYVYSLQSSIENIKTKLESIQKVKCGDLITSDRQNSLVSIIKDFVNFLHSINKLYNIVEFVDCKNYSFNFEEKLTIDSTSYFSLQFSFPIVTIVDDCNYLVKFVLLYKKFIESNSSVIETNVAKVVYKEYIFSNDFSSVLKTCENSYIINNVNNVKNITIIFNVAFRPPLSNTSSIVINFYNTKISTVMFGNKLYSFNICKESQNVGEIFYVLPSYYNNVLIIVLRYAWNLYEVIYLKYYL